MVKSSWSASCRVVTVSHKFFFDAAEVIPNFYIFPLPSSILATLIWKKKKRSTVAVHLCCDKLEEDRVWGYELHVMWRDFQMKNKVDKSSYISWKVEGSKEIKQKQKKLSKFKTYFLKCGLFLWLWIYCLKSQAHTCEALK